MALIPKKLEQSFTLSKEEAAYIETWLELMFGEDAEAVCASLARNSRGKNEIADYVARFVRCLRAGNKRLAEKYQKESEKILVQAIAV